MLEKEKKEWLDFLQTPPPKELLEIKQLEYDSLRNILQGTHKTSIMHQQQQQHKQHKQHQQQQQFISENVSENRDRMRRAKDLLEKEESARTEKTDTSDLIRTGLLANKTRRLKVFKDFLVKERNQHIAEIINIKIEEIENPENKLKLTKLITTIYNIKNSIKETVNLAEINISIDALKKIVDNLDYFVDGVTSDNLPAGFFLSEDKKKLLFDSIAFENVRNESSNGYTNPAILTERKIGREKSELPPITIGELQESLEELYKIYDNLEPLGDDIFEELGFTPENLKALAPVLNDKENGATLKTYTLLNTLKTLKNEDLELYENIKTCFIDKSGNLLDITDLETLKTIQKINKLSPAQKDWWIHLTTQHTSNDGVGKSDIKELYSAFTSFNEELSDFWQEVYGNDFEPPYPCPFALEEGETAQAKNMTVALKRIAYIVKHAARPNDQLKYLKGLDLKTTRNMYEIAENGTGIKFVHPKLTKWEKTNSTRYIFLKTLYTDIPEKDTYFPSYTTAKFFFDRLEEKIEHQFAKAPKREDGIFIDDMKAMIAKSAADMFKREVQSQEIFQCFNSIINLTVKKASQELTMRKFMDLSSHIKGILIEYPIFTNDKGLIYSDAKYFELTMKNPSVNIAYSGMILVRMNQVLELRTKSEEQSPKENILKCVLSIKLEGVPKAGYRDRKWKELQKLQEITDKLYELYEENPKTLKILARILINTDFSSNDPVTKSELYEIIEVCKTIDPVDYKTVRKIVDEKTTQTEFLPDLEYAKSLANEAPKDLHAVIKLFESIFEDIGFPIDSKDLSKTGITAKEFLGKEIESDLGFTEKQKIKFAKRLVKKQWDKLTSKNEEEVITGLIEIVKSGRGNILSGEIVKGRLKEIQETQIKQARTALKALGFEEEYIDILIQPISDIDLRNSPNLLSELERLVEVTSWVNKFATNYIELATKWDDPENKFLKLVNDNFKNVQDKINDLLNLYAKYPKLNDSNFYSPFQILSKILPETLTHNHVTVLKIIAKKQTSDNPIPIEQVTLLIDISLASGSENLTESITNLVFNEEYGDFPTNDFLIFAKNLIDTKENALEKLNEIIDNLTLSFAETRNPEEREELNSFLEILLSKSSEHNVMPYFYLKKILKSFDQKERQKVFKVFSQILKREEKHPPGEKRNSVHSNIFLLIAYLKQIHKLDKTLFDKVIALFSQHPCPSSKQLLGMFQKNQNIEEFVYNFEIDPYKERLDAKGDLRKDFSSKHFSTKRVNKVIFGLSKDNPELNENPELLEELRADFKYINAIGSTHNFPGTEKKIWQMSRKELLDHLEKCKEVIRDPEKTDTEKYLAKLRSIALLRETMYRTTKKTPNSTQILSVLMETKFKGDVCMQINTGEGKSLTNPLLAAMQHISGYAVNIFTSNTLLAKRDKKKTDPFWKYLGIPTAFISKNSSHNTYLENGINYTTPADFALFSASGGANVKTLMAGVYDESDLAFYKTNTEFNFSDSIDKENKDPYKNPYEWVYPLINNFVEEDNYYRTLTRKLALADTEEKRLKISNKIALRLRAHLKSQANPQQLEIISEDKVDGNRLLRWLAAAESIKKLELGKDYIVRPMTRKEYGETKSYRHICLLDGEGHEIEGAILANGAHQLLSAQLQKEIAGTHPFVIDKESFCISSRSAHTELMRMDKIIGITGTMGHDSLIGEFQRLRNRRITAIKVPPHKTNKRRDLPPRFAKDSKQHIKSIKKELSKSIGRNQLVIGPDTKECESLFNELKSFAKTKRTRLIIATASGYELYDGKTEETKPLTEKELFIEAAKKRTIIVATPLLGRGVDIEGLAKVIKTTFDPNARLESQVDGRTGRYGAKGTTVGIYDWQRICDTFPLSESERITKKAKVKRKILDNIRHQAQEEEIKRLYLTSKIKGISIRHQQYFDQAIVNSPEQKQAILFAKHIFTPIFTFKKSP